MPKYKYLVLSDLDGTLLNSEGKLSSGVIKYVHELNKRDDILFSFSTGRGWKDSSEIYKSLNLKGFVSCCNGAFIHNPHTNQAFYSFMSKNIWEDILSNEDYLKGIKGIDIMTDKGCFVFGGKDSKSLLEDMRSKDANVFCIKCYFNKPGTSGGPSEQEIVNKLIFLKSFVCRPSITLFDHINSLNIELQAHYVSKEKSVEILGAFYGVPAHNILTFGDQVNDLSVAVGTSRFMAVRNAIDFVKEKTPRISLYSNDEDAVIKEIDLFLKSQAEVK